MLGWKVWIIDVAAKNNNIHSFVSVFGADRYMHVMTAMTKNDATFAGTWLTAITVPSVD